MTLPYVVRNLVKNAVAPVVLPLARGRGSLGMDGDVEALQRVLGEVFRQADEIDLDIAGLDVLELGPGRTPQLSMSLVLCGAASALGLDTQLAVPADWDRPEAWRALAADLAAGPAPAPPEVIRSRAEELASGPHPVAFREYSGAVMPIDGESIDLVVSKSVLEHVASAHVDGLVAEMSRVLRPGGHMIHLIDLRDHMWIDRDEVRGDWLDALRYSDPLFRAMFSRRSTSINRLRSVEWRRLFDAHGFAVRRWEERRYDLPPGFSPSDLAPPWRELDRSELSIGQIYVALQKA